MDEHAVQQYLDQVPVEIREAVMELDTPHKWAVYIALTVEGDKYFNQLKKQFNANPKTLTDILRSLVASGLVDRKVKQLVDAGDTNKNYYTTTKLGEKLMVNLYEAVLPPLPIGKIHGEQVEITRPAGNNVEFLQPGEHYVPVVLHENQKSIALDMEGVPT